MFSYISVISRYCTISIILQFLRKMFLICLTTVKMKGIKQFQLKVLRNLLLMVENLKEV